MTTAPVNILTVSQLTRRVKGLLENQVGNVWVSGEISNWRVSPAGHAYFTLKDEGSQLDAVIFRGRLMKQKFEPESGLEVVAHGQVSVYERRGNYQLICDGMQPKGMGALQLAFEKLKAKLQEEGLFDAAHKKPIPLLPRRIGIVTSPTGAAVRDMLHVLNRRFANVHVLIRPARVQGDAAAAEIVSGIKDLEDYGVDVIIIGRGGGSLEDLWAFNEEILVRAVHEAETPIISAVGHEIDFALTDFAADLRAPTPSAAAELVVQERSKLVERLQTLGHRLARGLSRRAEQGRHRLRLAAASRVFAQVDALTRNARQSLDDAAFRLEDAVQEAILQRKQRLSHAKRALGLLSPQRQLQRARERVGATQQRLARISGLALERARTRLGPVSAHLDALSPLAILKRGYALALKEPDGAVLTASSSVVPGDTLVLKLAEGSVRAEVREIHEEGAT